MVPGAPGWLQATIHRQPAPQVVLHSTPMGCSLIRRLLPAAAVAIALLLAAPTLAQTPAPSPVAAPPPDCTRTYTRDHVRRAARSVYRSTSRVTRREKRQLGRFVRCARRPASQPVMRRTIRKWRRWRRSGRGYWRLASERLSRATHAGLARLRGCETHGKPYPTNYRWSGLYHGAYQYDARTWGEAGGTGLAYQASKDEQDVRTARFYPGHAGRWPNCSM